MGKILVFTEFNGSHLKRSAQELLTTAKKSGHTVLALAVGSKSAEVSKELAQYGAQEIHLFKDSSFDQYNPELFLNAISDFIKNNSIQIILASASSIGKDLFPRIAAKLDAGVASDCTEISITGDDVVVKKPMYSGKCFAKIGFEKSSIKIILMRANQLQVSEPNSSAEIKANEHSVSSGNLKTLIKEIVKGTTEKVDLTEANIIVSGGRGLKEAGNFKLLQDLAETLGATVGASRAVVDAGWVSHEMQVGQTGKTVAPSLYIAVGISGAIQHLAGMSGSKVIVAINSDPNAPIFQKATYGIVGDFADVVPKLTDEFKRALK